MSMSKEEIEAVMWHHINAVGSGDMAEILKDYTEESLIVAPQGTFQGLDNLPPFFTTWLESLTPEMSKTFEITHQHIQGDVAYIIRDGKIMTGVSPFSFGEIAKSGKRSSLRVFR